ncbi:hypothetical protein ACFPOI_51380 [Nonomuraea angiospora]|uniref:Uncharacterized protein n=1 Tax=Nonomuraea angiospora TaxID=46172 RepID=A0ABR9M2Q3_9ACTN|nr:hypothetical protein [Nonomuraea angiospora]MBE1586768.1 hypothetical protein [Nonomuraea angiospora]
MTYADEDRAGPAIETSVRKLLDIANGNIDPIISAKESGVTTSLAIICTRRSTYRRTCTAARSACEAIRKMIPRMSLISVEARVRTQLCAS